MINYVTNRYNTNLSDRYKFINWNDVIKNNDIITKQNKKIVKNSMYDTKCNIDELDSRELSNFYEYNMMN